MNPATSSASSSPASLEIFANILAQHPPFAATNQQFQNLEIGVTIQSDAAGAGEVPNLLQPGQASWQLSANPGSGSGVIIDNLPIPEGLKKVFVHGEEIEGGLKLTLSWLSDSTVMHPTSVELRNLPIPKGLLRIYVEGTRYRNGLILSLRWETTADAHNVYIPAQPDH